VGWGGAPPCMCRRAEVGVGGGWMATAPTPQRRAACDIAARSDATEKRKPPAGKMSEYLRARQLLDPAWWDDGLRKIPPHMQVRVCLHAGACTEQEERDRFISSRGPHDGGSGEVQRRSRRVRATRGGFMRQSSRQGCPYEYWRCQCSVGGGGGGGGGGGAANRGGWRNSRDFSVMCAGGGAGRAGEAGR